MLYEYPFQKEVNAGRLTAEVRASNIVTALDRTVVNGGVVTLYFKGELSTAEVEILDGVITSHVNEPLPRDTVPTVRVQEEGLENTGIFIQEGGEFDTTGKSAGETLYVEHSWPYDVSLLEMQWTQEPEFKGNRAWSVVSPNTPIGPVQADADLGNTELQLTEAAIGSLKLGYSLKQNCTPLGNDGELLGYVVEIDAEHNTVTLDRGIPNGIVAATNVFMEFLVNRGIGVKLGSNGIIQIGSSKIGGSTIPKGVVFRAAYHLEQNDAPHCFPYAMELKILAPKS